MPHENLSLLKLVIQNDYSHNEFLAEANKINADPLSRIPSSERSLLDPKMNLHSTTTSGRNNVFIDNHAHSFNIKHIPSGFSKIIKKIPARKLQLTIRNWAKLLKQEFLEWLGKESKDIYDKLYESYSSVLVNHKIYLVNLMMDMERSISGTPIKTFEEQLIELITLRNQHSTTGLNYTASLLPFFAFDPHNPNAYKQFLYLFLATNTDLFNKPEFHLANSNRLSFVGVKLYPPLGYSPKDETLYYLFKACESKNIPILSHQGGIRTRTEYEEVELKEWTLENNKPKFSKNNSGKLFVKSGVGQLDSSRQISNIPGIFMDPFKWEEVFNHFPKLKICLAHMGDNLHWQEFREIFQLFKKYNLPFNSQNINSLHTSINSPHNNLSTENKNELLNLLPKLATNFVFKTLSALSSFKNVYADISYCFVIKENMKVITELLMDNEWSNKILFGSDFYMTAVEKEGHFKKLPFVTLKNMIEEKDKEVWKKITYYNTINYLFGEGK